MIRPAACVIKLYILKRGSSSVFTFSTKDTYFDPPRFVCALTIYFISRSLLCQQKIH